MSLIDEIPGYRAAIESETREREKPFAFWPELICGVEVKPLSASLLARLALIESPLVIGGIPSPVDVGLFMWCVSFQHERALRVRSVLEFVSGRLASWALNRIRLQFIRSIAKKPYRELAKACADYVAAAFDDAPGFSRGETISYYAATAGAVDSIARTYHWSEREILELPLKRLWQYRRRIEESAGRKIFWNRSDTIRGKWLAEKQPRN